MGEITTRQEELPEEKVERIQHIVEELNLIEQMIRKDD